jgi:hypothetical protein
VPDVVDARIICICIYYDEHPEWLGEHMASLAPVCSDFVYVDGAYGLYPGASAKPASPRECATSLHSMALATGRPLLHYRPSRPFFGNEVEKRNMSLDLARSLPEVVGDQNVWFLVADADTVAIKVNDALPRILGETDRNVGEYAASAIMNPVVPPDPDRWAAVRAAETEKPLHVRCVYRNLPGLRYGPAHWHVTWGQPGRDRRWLWGGNLRQQDPCIDLSMELRFEHRQLDRDLERQRASKRYYEIRDITGIEDANDTRRPA